MADPTNYFVNKYGDPSEPAAATTVTVPTATTPVPAVRKESALVHDAEIAGAIGLGAAGTAIGFKYPAARDALGKLRDFIVDHPFLGTTGAGAITGAAVSAPHAISTDHPGEILAGGAFGAGAGLLGRSLGPISSRLAMLGTSPAERLTARTALEDAGNASAASARLKQLATNMRAGARSVPPNQETIGDVLGPRGQALAQTALASPDLGSQAYANQLAQRQAGTAGRITDTVNRGLVPSTPFDAEQQKLLQTMKANAKPLYDAAYSQFPSIQSNELYSILRTKPGKAAAKKAFQLMQMDGVPIGPAGVGGMVQKPSLQFLDYVKRALDDQVSGARRAGNNNEGRLLGGMRDRLVNELDAATTLPNGTSPYAQARQQYQSDRAVYDALNDGLNEYPKLTPEQVRAKVGAMSFAEKDAYRSGVAEGLFRQLGNVKGGNPGLAIAGSDNQRQKLLAMFDDPKKAQAFVASLQREADMFSRTKGLLGQGQRGARMAAQGSPGVGPLAVKAGLHSINPKLAVLRAAVDAFGAPKVPGGPVSDIMRLSGQPASDKLTRLGNVATRLSGARTIGRNVGAAGTVVGGGAAGLIPEWSDDRGQQ